MSFDKNYPNRKDHRKEFTGAKAYVHSCRNGGSCAYCQGNRNINKTKLELVAKDELEYVALEKDEEYMDDVRG